MADKQRQAEKRVLRKLAPWLSLQLEDTLELLGRPEDKDYISSCPAAMSVDSRLDAELGGTNLKVAVEHTSLDTFPEQRGISSVLADLRDYLRQTKAVVPRGNSVILSVSTDCVRRNDLNRRAVKSLIPNLDAKLKEYLARLPMDPTHEDAICGYQLEESLLWPFGPLEIRVTRYLFPGGSHVSLRVGISEAEWKAGLLNCLGKALEKKVGGKSSSYEAYRSEGWLALVVIQLADFQISIESAADTFRKLAGGFDLRLVDGIVLASELDAENGPLECCWAYLRGEVRSSRQQYTERCQCLGVVPNL